VLSSTQDTVLLKTGCSCLRHFFLGFFLLATITFVAEPLHPAEAVSLDEAIRQLAERIAAIPSLRGPLRFEVHDDPTFDASQGQNWKATLRHELDRRKLSITEESAAPLLRVGATQTPTEFIFAAELLSADRQELCVVALKRAAVQVEALPVSSVRIEKQLLFESTDRIIDAASLSKSTSDDLLVLTYRNWELTLLRPGPAGAAKQTLPLSVAGARASRDPRAELSIKETEGQLQLPGKLCEFTSTVLSDMKCHAVRTTWRALPSLTSPCDSAFWKLQVDSNDWTAGDLLQVLPDGISRQGSVALFSDFLGPILSINGTANNRDVLVVIRNLRTGNYEVYKLTLACGN
jgi:hypothetical protein